jgi:cell division initiation protein
MSYTPVELRHVRLGPGLLGYRRAAVDRLLADVADSFEHVWSERGELADHVERLESDLARHRELEALLRTTLVSAERAAHELKDHARREAETIVTEARAEARSITSGARAERDLLLLESRRIRGLLQAALKTVAETNGAPAELAEPEAA